MWGVFVRDMGVAFARKSVLEAFLLSAMVGKTLEVGRSIFGCGGEGLVGLCLSFAFGRYVFEIVEDGSCSWYSVAFRRALFVGIFTRIDPFDLNSGFGGNFCRCVFAGNVESVHIFLS